MSNNINIEVGKRIFDARKKLKLSRVELGKKVKLHESTIKRYEDGQIKSLDIEKMKEFANALEIDPKELMGWDNNVIVNELHDDLPLRFKRRFYTKCDNKGNIISYTLADYYHEYQSNLDLYFDKLNDDGKKEAIKRIEELTYIPKYTDIDFVDSTDKQDIETMAAHNDHLDEDGELDKVKEDINDMKNW